MCGYEHEKIKLKLKQGWFTVASEPCVHHTCQEKHQTYQWLF